MKKILILLLCILLMFNCFSCIKTINDNEDKIINETIIETINEVIEYENNELFDVLDYIKGVHPGTAGSSLQVLSGAAKLMNVCKSKMALEPMVNAWVEKQDKGDYSNINESFSFMLENLKSLRDGDIEKAMDENDFKDYVGVFDENLCDKAVSLVRIVIDATK